MSSNVESMFYTREKPWHGLGVRVEEAPTSADALRLAGLDWEVAQEPIFTEGGDAIAGYKVNVRDSDRKVLGVVSDRYKIIQNREAFSFTDALLGNGVRYETAGSLQEGNGCGFWQGCRGSTLLPGSAFPLIWYSATPTTGAAPCGWR